jgi:hypothetical protein
MWPRISSMFASIWTFSTPLRCWVGPIPKTPIAAFAWA